MTAEGNKEHLQTAFGRKTRTVISEHWHLVLMRNREIRRELVTELLGDQGPRTGMLCFP